MAGCIERIDAATYTDWLALDDGSITVAYADLDIDDDEETEFDPLSIVAPSATLDPIVPDVDDDAITDPLLAVPLELGGAMLNQAAGRLAPAGLAELLEPNPEIAFESEVSQLLAVNEATVVTGDLDIDECREQLEADDPSPLVVPYKPTEEHEQYQLYEPTDETPGPFGPGIVSLDAERLIVAEDRETIDTLIATRAGDHERATDASDTLDWLVETVEDVHLVAGHIDPSTEGFSLDDAVADPPEAIPFQDDLLAGVAFDTDDETIDARFALESADLDEATQETLEANLGEPGADVDFVAFENRVTASASYDLADLDIEFQAPGVADETLPPDVVEDILPAEDVIVTYYPPEEFPGELATVQVSTDRAITVDMLRVSAIEAGETAEVTPHEPEAGLSEPSADDTGDDGTGIGAVGDDDSTDESDNDESSDEGDTDEETIGTDVRVRVPADPGGDEIVVDIVIDGAVGEVTRETVP